MNMPIKVNGTKTGQTENFVCSVYYDNQKAMMEIWSTTRKDTIKSTIDGPELKSLLTMLILSKQVPHLTIEEEKPWPRTVSLSFAGKKGTGTVNVMTQSGDRSPLKTIDEEEEDMPPAKHPQNAS